MAVSTNEKNVKSVEKGVMRGSRDLLVELWDPYTSGNVEARNFKFGTDMGGSEF